MGSKEHPPHNCTSCFPQHEPQIWNMWYACSHQDSSDADYGRQGNIAYHRLSLGTHCLQLGHTRPAPSRHSGQHNAGKTQCCFRHHSRARIKISSPQDAEILCAPKSIPLPDGLPFGNTRQCVVGEDVVVFLEVGSLVRLKECSLVTLIHW